MRRTDVMLVAAKKEIVDDYLEMLENIGLQATIVDVDGFALENTFEYNTPKNENVALVDIGASKMNINIISGGMSVVARDIVVGSRQLTEHIMNEFDLEFDEAEALNLVTLTDEARQMEIEEIFTHGLHAMGAGNQKSDRSLPLELSRCTPGKTGIQWRRFEGQRSH